MSDEKTDSNGATPPGAPDTSSTPEWLMALPEHYEVKNEDGDTVVKALRADGTLRRYKTVEEAARGLIEQQKIIGKGINRVPTSDASLEEKRAFWDKLGVPEDIDGYVDVKPPDVEGLHWDEEAMNEAKHLALKNGVLPSQLQEFVNLHAKMLVEGKQKMINGWLEQQDGLQEEWGVSFKGNCTKAKNAFLRYFDKDTADTLMAAGLDYHPGMLRGFYKISQGLAEHGFIEGGVTGHMDVSSAKAKIEAMRKDPKHPAMDPGHKGHAAAYEDMMKLYKIAYPERS